MTKDDALRIATSMGVVLIDPATAAWIASQAPAEAGSEFYANIFEPEFWAARDELVEVSGGRGSAWFVSPGGAWVLRHARRGGFIAHVSRDAYVWAGEGRVRTFAEWRLLAELTARGLPVPRPIAARYRRRGALYRCDLITLRIAGAQPLSRVLAASAPVEGVWRTVGATLARLHGAGADHADLNAHNILLDASGRVSIIDFDRGRLRAPSDPRHPERWALRNLSRLQRSLIKISAPLPPERYSAIAWQWLSSGYQEAPATVPG